MSLLSNYNNFETVIGAVKYIIYYNYLVLHAYNILNLHVGRSVINMHICLLFINTTYY